MSYTTEDLIVIVQVSVYCIAWMLGFIAGLQR